MVLKNSRWDRAFTMRIRVKASIDFHVGPSRGWCGNLQPKVDQPYYLCPKLYTVGGTYYNGPIRTSFYFGHMQIGRWWQSHLRIENWLVLDQVKIYPNSLSPLKTVLDRFRRTYLHWKRMVKLEEGKRMGKLLATSWRIPNLAGKTCYHCPFTDTFIGFWKSTMCQQKTK